MASRSVNGAPTQQISPAPCTPNHSLPLTWHNCETTKTLRKHQSPYFMWGAEDCKNPTGRKLWMWLWMRLRHEDGRVPDARKLQCAHIVGYCLVNSILYFTTPNKLNSSKKQNKNKQKIRCSGSLIFTAVRIRKPQPTIRRATMPMRIHRPLFAQPRYQ